MPLERLPSLLFVVWTFLAAVIWWNKLKAPVLFLVVVVLVGLGAQTVSNLLWAMWQASNNQFFSASPEEVHAVLLRDAVFHAVVTFCIVTPVCILLSRRL